MGYTYAIYVQTGKERDVVEKIKAKIHTLGNPGIIDITAFDTFTQFINKKIGVKKIKVLHAGYIYVTVANTESSSWGGNFAGGLGMDGDCYQLLKNIPFVKKILNQYIPCTEWEAVKASIGHIEPEIEIAAYDFRFIHKIKNLLTKRRYKKEEAARQMASLLMKIKNKTVRGIKVYVVPYALIQEAEAASILAGKAPPGQTPAQALLQTLENAFKAFAARVNTAW